MSGFLHICSTKGYLWNLFLLFSPGYFTIIHLLFYLDYYFTLSHLFFPLSNHLSFCFTVTITPSLSCLFFSNFYRLSSLSVSSLLLFTCVFSFVLLSYILRLFRSSGCIWKLVVNILFEKKKRLNASLETRFD
jgi:hypothetical protein